MTDVEEFIAEHGVTRCPTAYLNPSTAKISAEDAAAHEARGIDPVGDMWRKKRAKKSKGGWAAFWAKKKGRK